MTTLFQSVSLDPSPTVDAYKSGVDETLIRAKLELSVKDLERIAELEMIATLKK